MGEEGPLRQEWFICLFRGSNGFQRSGIPLWFQVSQGSQGQQGKASSNLGQVPVCRTVLKFDKVQYCDIDLTANPCILILAMSLFMFFPSPLGLSCWHAVGGREALPAEACVLRVWWILCVSCRLLRRYFKMRLSQSPSVTSLGCCICSPLFSKQVESSFEATRCLFL